MMTKRIVICGGHLTPALALIDELKKEKGIEIIFFGRKHSIEGSKNLSAEYKIIHDLNIKFIEITTGRLQRVVTIHTIPSLLKLPLGFIQSLFYLFKFRPKMVVSFGSYLSVPIIFASWLLGVKSITHEQSSTAGLANEINALFVEKVFTSWPQTNDDFPKSKVTLIGNLTRKQTHQDIKSKSKINDFLKKSENLIFITGGNQGSHFINNLIFESQSKLSDYDILHQVGTANYKGDQNLANSIKKSNYKSVDYLNSYDFSAALNKSKIVISRSGANTVWEIAQLKKKSVLIPLPRSSKNEQYKNAKILEDANQAVILMQKEANPKTLLEAIEKVQKKTNIIDLKLNQSANQNLAKYIISRI